jgi:hypothetical protein
MFKSLKNTGLNIRDVDDTILERLNALLLLGILAFKWAYLVCDLLDI